MAARDFVGLRPTYGGTKFALVNEIANGAINIPYVYDSELDPTVAPAPGELHFGPTLPTRHNETMPERIGDGAVLCADGALRALSYGGSGTTQYTWADPRNTASYTTGSVDSILSNYASMFEDPVSGALMAGVGISGSTGSQLLTYWNLGTGGPLGVADFPFGTGSDFFAGNSAITTDGTYVYVVLQNAIANSYILKFDASGAFVTSIQLTNPPSNTSKNATNIRLHNGFLYVTGNQGNGWIAKVPVDLSTVTDIQNFSSLMSAVDDDHFIRGNYIVFGCESAGQNGRWCKVNLSNLSDQTYYQTALGQGIDGFYDDGVFVWIGHLGNPSYIAAVDFDSGVVKYTQQLLSGEQAVNEIFRVPGGFTVLTYQAASHAIFVPVPVAYDASSIAVYNSDVNLTNWRPALEALDDSTSTIKGRARVVSRQNPAHWALFDINSVVDEGAWTKINVTGVAASSPVPFTDPEDVALTADRTGDKGNAGTVGPSWTPWT
jgi:hypothetical protein